MAHHQSAKKRIRQTAKLRLRNRYYAKTMRNSVREYRELEDAKQAEEDLPKVMSNIDKLAKRGVIHKKKAANLKSKLAKKLNALKSS